MMNAPGPNSARPDDNSNAQTNPSPETSAESPGSPPPPGLASPANDAATVAGAEASATGAETPETKEKNKIFETVRLKARLTMAEQELEKVTAELERLRAAPAEYHDKNMRLLADMENLRRRTERERSETAKFAITRFARDVLSVADNFQRAIETAPAEIKTDDGLASSFYQGVELTGRELLNVLERHGVKRIDPTGQRFDPNVHQAMMQTEKPDVPAGTVLQTFQPAYMIEDRVLRPAMVVVSTGGPKPLKSAGDDEVSAADIDVAGHATARPPGSEPPQREPGEAS